MSALQVIDAPHAYIPSPDKVSLFLGGSIEQGRAENWQKRLAHFLEIKPYADRLVLLNPRRKDWDTTIPTNDPIHPALSEQINWELQCQDRADILVYWFAEKTVSPVTLFELGLYLNRQPIVGASPDYQRYGNLVLTAKHFDFPVYNGWDSFAGTVDQHILRLYPQPASN